MKILLGDLFNKWWTGRPLLFDRTDCLFFDDAIKIIFFAFKISFRERLILAKSRCSSSNEIILFWELIASDVFKFLFDNKLNSRRKNIFDV